MSLPPQGLRALEPGGSFFPRWARLEIWADGEGGAAEGETIEESTVTVSGTDGTTERCGALSMRPLQQPGLKPGPTENPQ